ncbi:MAG: tryptophan--tRNA ligase [Candidatus Curtissbacteria bacterium]
MIDYKGGKGINMNRILTGDRPTGRLHLGHYVGTLKNRVKLQDEYECFFIIADLHTLTTRPEKTGELKENIHELVLDYLSIGIDPAKSTIYVQSQIPEVSELAVIFGNLVTVNRLERLPTLKDVMRDSQIEIPSYGLLGYPVLQSADILTPRAHLVPVGKDQASHIEVTREIAREFNRLYPSGVILGSETTPESDSGQARMTEGGVFPIPEALIPEDFGTLPGTDGKAKMSKSAGNVINLSDSPEEVKKKVMGMFTDPNRVHGDEPGEVENNPVFVYLDAFAEHGDPKKINDLKARYREGKVKDVEVKEYLVEVLERFLEPIRAVRAEFEKKPELIDTILKEGTERARLEARQTLEEVRRAMKIDYF